MTVSSPRLETSEEHRSSSNSSQYNSNYYKKRTPYSNYNNNKRRTPYNNNTRYYPQSSNQTQAVYPPQFIYYSQPASVYYPPPLPLQQPLIDSTRDEEDVEIIMHDDSIKEAAATKGKLNLQQQLEYYFSRQNLMNDTYLISQMDKDHYVPVALVANFKRVRELTTDLNLITQTFKNSKNVTVDDSGTKVKPNLSVLQRKTVILRDVPECSRQEIDALLQELNAPKVVEIKKEEIGNMWYFTFESEQDALNLLLAVRGKEFKGQLIAARMKSEPVVRLSGSVNHTWPTVNVSYGNNNTTTRRVNTNSYQQRYNNVNSGRYSNNNNNARGQQQQRYNNNQRIPSSSIQQISNGLESMSLTNSAYHGNKTNYQRNNNNNRQHYHNQPHHNYNNNNKRYHNTNSNKNVEVNKKQAETPVASVEINQQATNNNTMKKKQYNNINSSGGNNTTQTNNKQNNSNYDHKKRNKHSSRFQRNHNANNDETKTIIEKKEQQKDDVIPYFPPLPTTNTSTTTVTDTNTTNIPPQPTIADIVKQSKPKESTSAKEKEFILAKKETDQPNVNLVQASTTLKSYADMLKK